MYKINQPNCNRKRRLLSVFRHVTSVIAVGHCEVKDFNVIVLIVF